MDEPTFPEGTAIENTNPELQLREREVTAYEREVAVREREAKKSAWSHPIVIAILVAGLGLIGNSIVTFSNNSNQRELEKQRAQSNLIFEAIKTGESETACKNLLFFVNIGMLEDAGKEIYNSCKPGSTVGPSLPAWDYIFSGGSGGTIKVDGIVLDADKKTPVAGAAIIIPEAKGEISEVQTDVQGRFQFNINGYLKMVEFSVEKDGYESVHEIYPPGKSIAVALRKKPQ
jgi:hypothetical protein